jgi:hypothetical protein
MMAFQEAIDQFIEARITAAFEAAMERYLGDPCLVGLLDVLEAPETLPPPTETQREAP